MNVVFIYFSYNCMAKNKHNNQHNKEHPCWPLRQTTLQYDKTTQLHIAETENALRIEN